MSYVTLSPNYTTNALLFGTRWNVGVDMTNITYSFPGLNSTWVDYTNPGEPYQGFASFNAYQQQAVRNTLLAWSSVANLSFTEVADNAGGNGSIRIAYTSWQMDAHQLGYAYLPNDLASGGDVWLNAGLQSSLFQTFDPGTLGGFTLLHELGHALGLKHPGETSAYSSATLGTLEDTLFNTVMSSNAMPGVPLTLAGNIDRLPSTPMSLDIDALQYVYGANTTAHSGDDHYVFADTGKYLQVIYDTGGNDTIELAGTIGGEIDLRPGAWSQLGTPVQINGGAIQNPDTVQIYRTTLIENAIGSDGNDTLIGNDAANSLQGNAGNDTLIGGAGCDTLTGGTGADCYVLATDAQDIITDFSITQGDKLDLGQVISHFTGYTMGSDLFANGYLSLSQQGSNTLISYDTDGTATNDTAHNLVTFQNFNANSLTNVAFVQGIAATNTTAHLSFDGTSGNDNIAGSDGNDTITGGGGSDTISGGNGDDVITVGGSGNGPLAFTTLVDGGSGTDSLNISYAASIADFVTFSYNGGTGITGTHIWTDTNGGSISFQNIESIYVGGASYTFVSNDPGMGWSGGVSCAYYSSTANKVVMLDNGTSHSDLNIAFLRNNGVPGMMPVHYADPLDIVGTANADNISVTSGFYMATGIYLDGALTINAGAGDDSIDMTANATNHVAADIVYAGAGNDVIYVSLTNLATDLVLDGGDGTDTLSFTRQSAVVNYTLNTNVPRNFENLVGGSLDDTLTGDSGINDIRGGEGNDTVYGGAGNDVLYGDDGADKLYGEAGNDTLNGGAGDDILDGGAGADTLTGGAGSNVFVLRAGDGGNGIAGADTISDFQDGTDALGLGGALTYANLAITQGNGTDTAIVNTIIRTTAGEYLAVLSNISAANISILDFTGLSTTPQIMNGTASTDVLIGALGSDTINGGGGSDTISGGNGDDVITVGGSGNGPLAFTTLVDGGSGTDSLNISYAASIADFVTFSYNGGTGITGTHTWTDTNGGSISFQNIESIYVGGASYTFVSNDPGMGWSGGVSCAYYSSTANKVVMLDNGTSHSDLNIAFLRNNGVPGMMPVHYADPLDIVGTANADNISVTSGFYMATGIHLDGALTINAGAGDDSIDMTANGTNHVAADIVYAGAGNDVIYVSLTNLATDLVLDGGDGTDTLSFARQAAVVVNYTLNTNVPRNFENLVGGDLDDTLTGDSGINDIRGGQGNDTVYGGADNDVLYGDGGADKLYGEAGNDTLNGGAGDDILDGGAGADALTGGAGIDTFVLHPDEVATITDFVAGFGGELLDISGLLDYTTSHNLGSLGGNPMSADKGFVRLVQDNANTLFQYDEDGAAGNAYTFHTVATLQGVTATDINTHNFNSQTIIGTAGDDILVGGLGDDTLSGLAGNDTLDGGAGADSMVGGLGADIYYVDNEGDVVVETDNTLSGPPGLRLALDLGSAIDKVVASISYTLGNFLENLTLAAGSGNLTGTGNELDNVLIGNAGANTLTGNGGNDTLTGGAGNDVFTYAASGNGLDTITDFSVGDKITVTGAAFSGAVTTGNGSAVLANQVQLASSGGVTTLYIGTDSVAGADIQIQLTGTFSANTLVMYGNTIALDSTPTGSVSITGTATQGQTLHAAHTLIDADGIAQGAIGYQWKADGANISGATGNTYVLTGTEIGKTITVVASYIDGHGTAESVTSSATTAVVNINNAPTLNAPNSLTVTEDVAGNLLYTGTPFADVDSNTLTVTLSITDGAITGNAGAGITTGGTPTARTFSGTIADLNSYFTTAGKITYQTAQNNNTARTLTTSVSDGSLSNSATSTVNITAVNDAPTGSVTITGTATRGQTLNAGNNLADADGLGALSYQWYRSTDNGSIWSVISGENGTSHVLGDTDAGSVLRADVTYTDGHGTPELVSSAATATVTSSNTAPTGSVLITGTKTQGQTLTASNSLADADGLGAISYQWKAGGANIAGATGDTYVLTEAQVGKVITVAASYTDGHGTAESKTSAATTAVANINDAGSVSITGTATQGQTLTATASDADGLGTGVITYQWKAGGANISGATGNTYTLTKAQVGKTITVAASYTDGHSTAENRTSSATSAVANINDAPTGSVTLSGTKTQGQTLTAANTLADLDGLGTISYQWKVDGTAITGATSNTYLLTEGEVGKTITVAASYTDGHGTAESAASTATAAVANANDAGSVKITGLVTQDNTLAATASDADGVGAITYQWKAGGIAINGATSSTYALTETEVGKVITVAASYTDLHGTAESVTSSATRAVAQIKVNGTYVVNNIGDVITEGFNEGTDLLKINIATTGGTYTLGDNIENGTLTNTIAYNLTGNALDNVLTGNAAANTLTGGAGNDTLNGGSGADTLIGGTGDDTYIVDNGDIVVTENVDEGAADLVKVRIATAGGAYTLGDNVENGTLTNAVDFNLTGNSLGNVLTGNTKDNVLDGGTGADILIGGNGNDTYIVNSVDDTVTETVAGTRGGTDLVQSSVNWMLGSNLENLTLTGADNINGTGNELGNVITGNAGNNILDGGSGVDKLIGGAGDDTYIVDLTANGALQDTITEAAGGGTDTLQLRGSNTRTITLMLATNLENLDASATGTTKLNLTGNALGNTLTGNAADNLLDGKAGNDILTGGTGNDKFTFSTALNATTNIDTLTDFSHGHDTIQLSKAIFKTLGVTGSLNADFFYAGTGAHDANDHIIYNASTGALYYDPDGTGAAAQVQFTTLLGAPTIASTDLFVV